MKSLLKPLICALSLLPLSALACEVPKVTGYNHVGCLQGGLASVEQNGKWGMIDKNNHIIIPLSYDDILDVSENKIGVKKNNKWGFIDKNNQLIIDFLYDEIHSFHQNMAGVKSNGKWQFIDQAGKPTIYTDYDDIFDFSNNIVQVTQNKKIGWIDKTKGVIIPVEYSLLEYFSQDLILARKDNKFGLIDKNANIVLPFEYSFIHKLPNGVAKIHQQQPTKYLSYRYGLIDKNGKIVVKPEYKYLSMATDDLFIAQADDNHKGVITKTGEIILPFSYQKIDFLSGGLIRATKDTKFGLFDSQAKPLTPFIYDYLGDFSEGLAVVYNKETRKNGFIDDTGKEVIPLDYDSAGRFRHGLSIVRLNDKYGMINKNNHAIIPIKYKNIERLSENLILLVKEGQFFYYDYYLMDNQTNIINKKPYDGIYTPSEDSYGMQLKTADRIKVSRDRLYGFVDDFGKLVIPIQYDDAQNFSDGLARVKQNGKWGFVDKSGRIVIPIQYDDARSFENGIAPVKLNGETFYIDKTGKRIN